MADLGRPPIEVDEELLEKLAKLHLSDKVIADCLDISVDTLRRRFAEKIDIWQSQAKSKIANVLFDEALNGRQPWALKTLAQRHLGYYDKTEIIQPTIIDDKPIRVQIGWADEDDERTAHNAQAQNTATKENQSEQSQIQSGQLGPAIGEDDSRS